MAYERHWESVSPVAFIANGGADGTITLSSTAGFKVKQSVVISAISLPEVKLEVKRVLSPTRLIVGPVVTTGQFLSRYNLSAYVLGNSPTIRAEEQKKATPPPNDIIQNVYEQEPTLAIRTTAVDQFGIKYGTSNPAPSTLYFRRDGSPQEVTEDTATPANNRPLPVKLTGFDGDVVINADNLNLETQLDGVYDGTLNSVPDTVGLVAHTRSTLTDKTTQVERVTAKRGTVDTDTVSQDVSLHDSDGNAFSPAKPLPVFSTYEKFIAMISASAWMKLGVYDEIIPSINVDDLILTYKEDGAVLGTAVVSDYLSIDGWSLKLNRYIDDDDGTPLLDDDDSFLNLD